MMWGRAETRSLHDDAAVKFCARIGRFCILVAGVF
jgi:hypothetical protein